MSSDDGSKLPIGWDWGVEMAAAKREEGYKEPGRLCLLCGHSKQDDHHPCGDLIDHCDTCTPEEPCSFEGAERLTERERNLIVESR